MSGKPEDPISKVKSNSIKSAGNSWPSRNGCGRNPLLPLPLQCADFKDYIFIHRSKAGDADWNEFRQDSKVEFTVGFNMRGPTGAYVTLLR